MIETKKTALIERGFLKLPKLGKALDVFPCAILG